MSELRNRVIGRIFESKGDFSSSFSASQVNDPANTVLTQNSYIAGQAEADPAPIRPSYSKPQRRSMTPRTSSSRMQQYYEYLKKKYQEWLDSQPATMPYNESVEIDESLGYSNPYAVRQPQQGQQPEEQQEIPLWDSMSGRIRKFPAQMGPPQGGPPLKGSREMNKSEQDGYYKAAANMRISQPSGGEDPRGWEIPIGFKTPVGASREELDFHKSYSDLEKRMQQAQQNQVPMANPWTDHPAVQKHIEKEEQLQQIQQADQMNAQGGQQQQVPGQQGGMPGMPGMGGQGGMPPEMMQMMQQMAGGKQGGQPPMPPMGGEKGQQGPPPEMMQMLMKKMMGGQRRRRPQMRRPY